MRFTLPFAFSKSASPSSSVEDAYMRDRMRQYNRRELKETAARITSYVASSAAFFVSTVTALSLCKIFGAAAADVVLPGASVLLGFGAALLSAEPSLRWARRTYGLDV